MAILELRYGEDEMLKRVCKEITDIDDDIKNLAQNMIDTMYKYDGIGLAAPQVGRDIRMLVYDSNYINEGAKKKPNVV